MTAIDHWRDDWNAGPNTAPSFATPTDLLFLHHSVTPSWRGRDAARRLQRIARGRGFRDYSYSCGCTVAPDAHEGRGGGRVQAATRGYNDRSHSLVLVGNFDEHPLPDALVEEVAQLVADGHRRGWWPDHITHPHRAVSSTACPGRYAVAAIPRINARAAEILRGGPEPEEDELPLNDDDVKRIAKAVWRYELGPEGHRQPAGNRLFDTDVHADRAARHGDAIDNKLDRLSTLLREGVRAVAHKLGLPVKEEPPDRVDA